MHRPSQRQAQFEARLVRRRKVERLLLAAPEPYTSLGERPVRALVIGAVLALVVTIVLGVISVAGAARAVRERQRVAVAVVLTSSAGQGWRG